MNRFIKAAALLGLTIAFFITGTNIKASANANTQIKEIANIRYNQANNYLKNVFYPHLAKLAKTDIEDYHGHPGTYFKTGPDNIDNGGIDTPDVSEASNGLYFDKSKFINNYVNAFVNYKHIKYTTNSSNKAADCALIDANYYTSVAATKQYYRKYHKSSKWLKNNLNHMIYGFASGKTGAGYGNFICGVQFYPVWGKNAKDVKLQIKQFKSLKEKANEYIAGLKWGLHHKPANLKNISTSDVNELVHSKYINNFASNSMSTN